MGNWNRRYIPRKKYSYNYQDFPPSPPGELTNSVPSWEIEFCKSHGVLWRKVVNAKKYIHCYDNILKWNDFAGEEAFHNSKKRYWEMINGIGRPRENPLPDPDLYIQDVDWNSYIDPKLISDLDQEYFNPDEVGKNENLEGGSSGSPVWNNKNAHDRDDNPWESSCVQSTGIVKCAAQSWGNQRDTSTNPWEQNNSRVDNFLDASRGWNQGQNRQNNNTGWGKNDCPGNAFLNDRQRGDWKDKSGGWKQSESTNDGRGGRGYNGCRKREGSMQHASRYKSPRFQGNDHGTGGGYQGWR